MILNSLMYPYIGGGGVSSEWVLLLQRLPAHYCRGVQFSARSLLSRRFTPVCNLLALCGGISCVVVVDSEWDCCVRDLPIVVADSVPRVLCMKF
jgi:hypothetical protein